ncbi:hypothetical protein ABPG72_020060 [Tetrahymena utriculariae]
MEIEEDKIRINTRIQVLHQAGIVKPQTILNKLLPYTEMSLRTMQRTVFKLNNGESLDRKTYERSPTVMTEESKNKQEVLLKGMMFTLLLISKQKIRILFKILKQTDTYKSGIIL